MDAQAIAAIATSVVAMTQLAKWAGLDDRKAPVVVLLFSLAGVGLWAYSMGTFTRALLFDYFAAWITVALSAAGVFGFTRSMPSAVTAMKEPPPGAGSSPTEKM
jgi:hypothetical protein